MYVPAIKFKLKILFLNIYYLNWPEVFYIHFKRRRLVVSFILKIEISSIFCLLASSYAVTCCKKHAVKFTAGELLSIRIYSYENS